MSSQFQMEANQVPQLKLYNYPALVAQWVYEQQIQVAALEFDHGGSNPTRGYINRPVVCVCMYVFITIS